MEKLIIAPGANLPIPKNNIFAFFDNYSFRGRDIKWLLLLFGTCNLHNKSPRILLTYLIIHWVMIMKGLNYKSLLLKSALADQPHRQSATAAKSVKLGSSWLNCFSRCLTSLAACPAAASTSRSSVTKLSMGWHSSTSRMLTSITSVSRLGLVRTYCLIYELVYSRKWLLFNGI